MYCLSNPPRTSKSAMARISAQHVRTRHSFGGLGFLMLGLGGIPLQEGMHARAVKHPRQYVFRQEVQVAWRSDMSEGGGDVAENIT